MKRQLFTNFPIITDNEPMNQTTFYRWLIIMKVGRFSHALERFLYSRGFRLNLHILPAEQVKAYNYTFDHFWHFENRKLGHPKRI